MDNKRKAFGLAFIDREYLWIFSALFICFAVHLLPIKQFAGWISTDVVGYYSHAATFTGHDWSGVLKNATSFYSWGYSLLLVIPMLFTEDFITVYYIAILMNAIICCGILLICYSFSKKLVPEMHCSLKVLVSLCISIYSSYLFQGMVMLSETWLYFFVFLDCWLIYQCITTEKLKWGIAASISIGFTYIIHNRSIGIVIAYIMLVLIWGIKRKSIKEVFFLLTPLFMILLLNSGVTSWLNKQEKQGQFYTRNTYTSQFGGFTRKTTFYGIISLMENMIGTLWYAIVGTFGVFFIGCFSSVKRLITNYKKKSDLWLLYLFFILSCLGTFGISVLTCWVGQPLAENGRYDLIYYGRYFETVIGIFLLLGMLELCSHKRKITELWNIMICCIMASVFFSAIVHYITEFYQNNAYNFWGIPAVLTTFFYPNRMFSVVNSSIVGILLMIFLFFLFSRKKNVYFYSAVMLLCFFFVFTGYNAGYNVSNIYKEVASVFNMPLYNQDFNDICNFINENNIESIGICSNEEYEPISFQINLPDREIIGIKEESELEQIKGIDYIIICRNRWNVQNQNEVIYENGEYLIYQK